MLTPSALSVAAGADLSRIGDARLLRALAWWHGLPRTGIANLPDRAALDPLSIPDLLPHVVLWEVGTRPDGSFTYLVRLAGTAMVEVHGYEFTGLDMAQFHGAENVRIQPEYDFVASSGQPHYVERSLFWMNRDFQRYRRILLPFTHRAATGRDGVAQILNVSHFLSGDDA